jgi:hypothetical protein
MTILNASDIATPPARRNSLAEFLSKPSVLTVAARVFAIFSNWWQKPLRIGANVIVGRHADAVDVLSRDLEFRIGPTLQKSKRSMARSFLAWIAARRWCASERCCIGRCQRWILFRSERRSPTRLPHALRRLATRSTLSQLTPGPSRRQLRKRFLASRESQRGARNESCGNSRAFARRTAPGRLATGSRRDIIQAESCTFVTEPAAQNSLANCNATSPPHAQHGVVFHSTMDRDGRLSMKRIRMRSHRSPARSSATTTKNGGG